MYVLIAIVRKQLKLDRSLSEILQILSLTLFEKVSLSQLLMGYDLKTPENGVRNQLNLFN